MIKNFITLGDAAFDANDAPRITGTGQLIL